MTGRVSPTLEVLTEMRDDIRNLGQRMDSLENHVAREFNQVAGVLYDVRDLLATRLDQRDRVNDHEVRIRAPEDQARRAG